MLDLFSKVREYVFHILCSVLCAGMFWREEEKEMSISKVPTLGQSLIQALSVSLTCAFHPTLLNNQKKASYTHSCCLGPALTPFLALDHISCALDLHWPCLPALFLRTLEETLTLLALTSQPVPIPGYIREDTLPQLCTCRPKSGSSQHTVMVREGWFEHLVWAFCLIIIPPAIASSNLMFTLVPVSLSLQSLPLGFGPMFNIQISSNSVRLRLHWLGLTILEPCCDGVR